MPNPDNYSPSAELLRAVRAIAREEAKTVFIDLQLQQPQQQSLDQPPVPMLEMPPVVTPVPAPITKPCFAMLLGHNSINQGARMVSSGRRTEWGFNIQVLELLNNEISKYLTQNPTLEFPFILVSTDCDGSYQEKHDTLNDSSAQFDFVFELHFNAFFSAQARGWEILSLSNRFSEVNALIKPALGKAYTGLSIDIPMREPKFLKPDARGFANIEQGTKILQPSSGYYILEPFFGTSPTDCAEIANSPKVVAQLLFQFLLNLATSMESTSQDDNT